MSFPGSREPFWWKCHSEVHGDRAALPWPTPALGAILPLSTGLSCSLLAPFLTSQLLFSFCSVKQRCLNEQKRRRQRATKKISIFIGSFVICFGPYIITRSVSPAAVEWGDCLRHQSALWWAGAGVVGLGKSKLIWDWPSLLEIWGHQNTHTCTNSHTFTFCCL